MGDLRDLGWIDGRTTTIVPRYAGAKSEQLPTIARDLVSRGVNVIVVWSVRAVAAVMEATTSVPVVGLSIGDLIGPGRIASLGRPAANLTGVADLQTELQGKRMGLLKEMVPTMRRVVVLSNPSNPTTIAYISSATVAAQSLGVQLDRLNVSAPEELDGALAELSRRRPDGLLVLPDSMFWAIRADIVRFAARARVPAIYWERSYVEEGGLFSYAASLRDIARRGGGVGR
jgi:putative tryptophan/tyrosine transport system substrate-binding protein